MSAPNVDEVFQLALMAATIAAGHNASGLTDDNLAKHSVGLARLILAESARNVLERSAAPEEKLEFVCPVCKGVGQVRTLEISSVTTCDRCLGSGRVEAGG